MIIIVHSKEASLTLLVMLVMKALMSSWVGQLFWQGASAHLRHLAASRSAALSLSVVCLMSSKFLSLLTQVCRGYSRCPVAGCLQVHIKLFNLSSFHHYWLK